MEVFSGFGTVLACCIQPNSEELGQSEGLVRMSSVDAASKAFKALDCSVPQDNFGTAARMPMQLQFFPCGLQSRPQASGHIVKKPEPE